MIALTTTSDVLRFRLGEVISAAEMEFMASYADATTTTLTIGNNDGTSSGTSNVSIVTAPGASTQRTVKSFSLFNGDTISHTFYLEFYDGTNARVIFRLSGALSSQYTFHYEEGEGYYVTDTTGKKLWSMDGKVATQAEEEAGTSLVVYTTPGRQHYHPSAAKCWGIVTVAAGVPTLNDNYNITSITDSGPGLLTFTIATDFSSANWACVCSIERASTALTVTNVTQTEVRNAGRAAGSVLIECWDDTATTHVQEDPTSWSMVGYGDQ